METPTVTLAQAMVRLGMSKTGLIKWIGQGKLRAKRGIKKHMWLLNADDVAAIERQAKAATVVWRKKQ